MQKLFLLLAACAAVASVPAKAVVLVDRIVAVVNKDVVTYSELNEAVGMAVRQLMTMARLREREVENRVQVTDSEVDLFLEQLKTRPAEGAEYNIAHVLV